MSSPQGEDNELGHIGSSSLLEGSESRRRQRRTLIGFNVLFLILIFVLSLLRSPQLLFVLSLYACIFLEGIFLTILILLSAADWGVGNPDVHSEDNIWQGASAGADIVSSLNIYVKYALRGSDFSRREIAYMLKNIVERGGSIPRGSKEEAAQEERRFDKDLQRVVYDYTVDRGKSSSDDEKSERKKKHTKQEREAYLASLERVLKRLGDGSYSMS